MSKLIVVASYILLLSVLRLGVAATIKQPADAWRDEIVPAAVDPEIQRLVDIMNRPPAWEQHW